MEPEQAWNKKRHGKKTYMKQKQTWKRTKIEKE